MDVSSNTKVPPPLLPNGQTKKKKEKPIQVKPKLVMKEPEVKLPGRKEQLQKYYNELKQMEEQMRYFRSLNIESYTVGFVKGKGVVIKNMGNASSFDIRR